MRMRLSRTLSSGQAQVGDNVDFEVLDDVKVGDVVVIPIGATALATVTEGVAKRRMGRAGMLNVNVDYVRLASGVRVPLRGVEHVSGGGHVGAMTGATVATSVVFFPAAPLFLFMHGKDVIIPKGHEVTCYTSSRMNIDAAIPPSGAITKLTGKTLTNRDVVDLKTAG